MPDEQREYTRFAFYRFAPSWRALPRDERDAALGELAATLARPVAPWQLCYSVAGLRADADFGVWLKADGIDPLQVFERGIRETAAGDHLELTHNFVSMTKPSPYARTTPETEEREKLRAYTDGAPYVFVYPMVKSRAWYALAPEERGRLMREHIAVGQKYPKIRINTSYSYGLDDQEFVVAFEGDNPAEFLDLVQELRYTGASSYTERDTPMFTCVLRSPQQLADEFRVRSLASAH